MAAYPFSFPHVLMNDVGMTHFIDSSHDADADADDADVRGRLSTFSEGRGIDDSTPVSQSRHTLRFQPIACRSIMRCPRVLTRPEMVWQAFVPDIASGKLAVFDMAEKNPGKQNCCYGQCKSDERYPVKCAGVTF